MRIFISTIIAGLIASSIAFAQEHALIKDAQSDYAIILPDDAIPAEQTAAAELQQHLEQITGVLLPIVNAADYKTGPMIAVGFNSVLPPRLRQDNYPCFSDEELIIDADGTNLLLAGGRPRGALYAVYEFLHQLGVRWYTPEYTKTPSLAAVFLPRHPYRYQSPVIGRKMNSGNNASNQWRARNRLTCNTLWAPLGQEYGSLYSEGPDMHTFWRLVPKSVLDAHPDWLTEIDGKREVPVGTTWGLCLSRPDVRDFLIQRTIDYAKKNPERKIIWIGQNDGSRYCTCDQCRAFYAEHGDQPSSLVVQLINELSDTLEMHVPGCTVKTLSYSWSLTPPENMTVRDNVVVMFCPAGNWFQSIESDPKRLEIRQAMAAWRKLVKHIDIYLYFPHDDYWSPGPCTYVGAENIKWCTQNGANHLYVALSGHGDSYGSEFMHLRSWVYNRLMWNPALDTQELIDEFIADYYGPAAPLVAQAVQWTHQGIYDDAGLFKEYLNNEIVPPYVNPEIVRKVNLLFDAAYDTLPDDIYKKHLRFAWIPYLWADFWLGFNDLGRYEPTTGTWLVPMVQGDLRNRYGIMIKQFMAEQGVNALKEGRKFNPAALGLDKMGKAWPAALLKENTVEAVIIPDVGGKISAFRNVKGSFLPLKESWQGLAYEYPLISTTQETVNGRQITAYKLMEEFPQTVKLAYAAKDYAAHKEISLLKEVLTTEFTIEAKQKTEISSTNCVMFDLAEAVFGFYPLLYLEKNDGTWTKRVMGAETDFHWVQDAIDLTGCTGRLVLQRQQGPEGVLMILQPDQLNDLYFWYSRYQKGSPEYCGMLRFFINAKTGILNPGEQVKLTWSLRIIPHAADIVGADRLH